MKSFTSLLSVLCIQWAFSYCLNTDTCKSLLTWSCISYKSQTCDSSSSGRRYGQTHVNRPMLFDSCRFNRISSHHIISSKIYHSKSSLKAFLDEDLPNIFGINPIEAAIIIGASYYFYGPATLYEYARTAGNFVATYLPIAQQVSGDIFNEFKDYFEEDRERELLKKQGFDMTDIPRRSSNIFERFQVCSYS